MLPFFHKSAEFQKTRLSRTIVCIYEWQNILRGACPRFFYANIKQQRNVGIDVGKTFLDIHSLEVRYWQIYNSVEDIKTLIKTLKRFNLTTRSGNSH
ncbi:hypothetical protein MARGE09_P4042 [Marinagarivorans cellulosilyticus]|uniref:Uncharacterized protein n=1 Tax=Marinagarivorans cellulosilyticus TaxID=2721545 RepID=A0AAN2BM91_9GAMM|nr:hypothetical protein MARGE09_P4042 [Marinagarivorans cellulosilyticus]